MALPRFETARDLFEQYPAAQEDIEAEPTDDPSLDYIKALVAGGQLEAAVGFCAYLLHRREAVQWACRCIEQSEAKRTPLEEAALRAAEAWVREATEAHRVLAMTRGVDGDRGKAATWAALAAAWSGGNFFQDGPVAPPPPHATAKAARAAVFFAAGWDDPKRRERKLRSAVEHALTMLKDDSLQHGRSGTLVLPGHGPSGHPPDPT